MSFRTNWPCGEGARQQATARVASGARSGLNLSPLPAFTSCVLFSSYGVRRMSTTRLSSRGQVVLPKDVRDRHQWKPGQEFEIVETDEGILLRAQSPFPDTTFDEVRGRTGYEGPPKATDRLTGTAALRKKNERE